MRFFSVTPRIVIGENSSISVMSFTRMGHHCPGTAPGDVFLLLPCGAFGGFRLRLGRRRLRGGLRRCAVAAHRSPGVLLLLFRDIAERPAVGPLGILRPRFPQASWACPPRHTWRDPFGP